MENPSVTNTNNLTNSSNQQPGIGNFPPPNIPNQQSPYMVSGSKPSPFKNENEGTAGSGDPHFPHFSAKSILIGVIALIFLMSASVGAFLFLFNKNVTNYTLIPDNTEFYLGISVKNHPQVQKLLELTRKMPGGEKMIEYIDENRVEILGTRKDPFKAILDLTEDEIFLAKIPDPPPSPSPTPSPSPHDIGRPLGRPQRSDDISRAPTPTNTLEQLVNIVEFTSKGEAEEKFNTIADDENIISTKEAYGSAELVKFELLSQKEDEKTQRFDTGALPYQVTLPLSRSIFATQLENFIVAADRESDVKKIIDIVTDKKEKKLKSLDGDEEHGEIVSHFPDEYLFKFYQKQVRDPFSNLVPTSAMPSLIGLGSTYDTRERETEGDNVFTTKRGLTIVAQDNGVEFSSYQLTDKSRIEQGLKHGFKVSGSLASRIPAKINGKEPLVYAEVRNIRDSIQDQLNQLEEVADNSSDERQRESFERAMEGIEEMKDRFAEFFNLDVDDDLLSWMDGQSAFMFLPGRNGVSPEALAIFEVEDTNAVEEKLSKFQMVDYLKQNEIQSKSAQLRNDIGSLATELQAYYTSPGEGFYPPDLQTLLQGGYLKEIPTNPFGGEYGYITCLDGTEAAVFGQMGEEGVFYAWGSEQGRAGDSSLKSPPTSCNITVNYSYGNNQALGRINAEISQRGNSNIYFYPIVKVDEEVYGFRFTFVDNLVIFSVATTDAAINDLIDLGGNPAATALSSDSKWQEQFAQAPQIVGSAFYAVPENILGIFEYYMAKYPEYSEYVEDDWVTVASGYLKALRSFGTTTTQEGQTFITKSFVNLVSLPDEENKKVEEALDRIIKGEDERSQRYENQSLDAEIKNEIGILATELQGYYTTPGEGKYPDNLEDLILEGGLREIPEHPTGESYNYIVCNDNGESLVYAKLVASEGYWVWSSVTNTAKEITTVPDTNMCISGPPQADEVVQGVKDSPYALSVFWANIKNSLSSP